MGKLFQLQKLGIQNNPLPADIMGMYNEPNGMRKLLEFMLDNLHGKLIFDIFKKYLCYYFEFFNWKSRAFSKNN